MSDSATPSSIQSIILQARTLEWVAFPSPGALHKLGIKPGSPALQADSLPAELPGLSVSSSVILISFFFLMYLLIYLFWGWVVREKTRLED